MFADNQRYHIAEVERVYDKGCMETVDDEGAAGAE